MPRARLNDRQTAEVQRCIQEVLQCISSLAAVLALGAGQAPASAGLWEDMAAAHARFARLVRALVAALEGAAAYGGSTLSFSHELLLSLNFSSFYRAERAMPQATA